MKSFVIHALWDAEAGVWMGTIDAIPVVSEAATLAALVERLEVIASERIAENGLAAPGEPVTLRVVAKIRSAAKRLPCRRPDG